MKKSIIALMALATLFASCAKESEFTPAQPEQQQQLYTLHAKVSDATKVSADNAGTFAWQAGDVISVLNNSNEPVNFTTPDGGAEVNFHGTVAAENLGSYAFYPANANHTNTVFALGPELDWSANASNMPMVGPIVSETATFAAVGAVIKLICFNVPADARLLQVTSLSKKIAGTFAFSGSPMAIATVNSGTDSEKTLTINFTADDIADCSGNMVFYVPVPSGELGKLTFALKATADGSALFSQQTKASITVAKNSIVTPPVLNCRTSAVVWKETFTGYASAKTFSSAAIQTGTSYDAEDVGGEITYTTSGSTKLFEETYAGGTSPEMLLNGSFTVSNIKSRGAKTLALTFKKNNTVSVSISGTNSVTASDLVYDSSAKLVTCTINNPNKAASFNLTFTASSNTRLDNFILTDLATAATPTVIASDIEILVGSLSASTDVAVTGGLDDFDPAVSVAESDKTWLSAELSSGTLTVTANAAKETAGDREGTVVIRVTGLSKSITVTQKSAFVAKPSSIDVTSGNASFSASWDKADHATGYAAYLCTESGLADPTADAGKLVATLTPSYTLATNKYSVSKPSGLTNGNTYYLYVKVSTVESNYVADDTYKEATVEPVSVAPLSTVSGLSIEDILIQNTSGNPTMSIKWSAVTNASGYEWVVSEEEADVADIDDIADFDEDKLVAYGDQSDVTEDEGVYSGTISSFETGMSPKAATVYYLYARAIGDGASYLNSAWVKVHAILYLYATKAVASGGEISGGNQNELLLSGIRWDISKSNVGNYDSGSYAGLQIGTSSSTGSICLTSDSSWGGQVSTAYYGYNTVKKVSVWMNAGNNGTISATVTVGGKSATSDGTTVSKNTSAGANYYKSTKVTYTPASDGKTGAIVITATKGTKNAKAGYFCAMSVLSE